MEHNDIVVGVRMDKELHALLVAEQKRIQEETGLNVSKNETVRLLLKRALTGKKKAK